jgi:hypothetical protein
MKPVVSDTFHPILVSPFLTFQQFKQNCRDFCLNIVVAQVGRTP